MGKGGHKETLSGTSAEHPRQEIDEPSPKGPCPILERTGQRREKVLKGIAVGEDETANPLWMMGNHQLAQGPPSIIADQGYLVEIEGFKKISYEVSHPKRAHIRIGMHRV
jgi:hypothetical protein